MTSLSLLKVMKHRDEHRLNSNRLKTKPKDPGSNLESRCADARIQIILFVTVMRKCGQKALDSQIKCICWKERKKQHEK